MLGVAEFAAVTVWPVAARQQRRVATLASQVPVPHHPDYGNARYAQIRTFTPSVPMHKSACRTNPGQGSNLYA
jgi:hypothetical protein